MDIERLRKLGQEATEGPWEVLDGQRIWHVARGSLVAEVHDSEDVPEDSEERDWGNRGLTFVALANARFIATARNVWDEMCDALKAAEHEREVRVRWERAHRDGAMAGHPESSIAYHSIDLELTEAEDRLDQALARLKNIDQEVGG